MFNQLGGWSWAAQVVRIMAHHSRVWRAAWLVAAVSQLRAVLLPCLPCNFPWQALASFPNEVA